jgi:hypothetical protein
VKLSEVNHPMTFDVSKVTDGLYSSTLLSYKFNEMVCVVLFKLFGPAAKQFFTMISFTANVAWGIPLGLMLHKMKIEEYCVVSDAVIYDARSQNWVGRPGGYDVRKNDIKMILLVLEARQAIPFLSIEFFINGKSMGKAIGRSLMKGMRYKAADFGYMDILFDYEPSHIMLSILFVRIS